MSGVGVVGKNIEPHRRLWPPLVATGEKYTVADDVNMDGGGGRSHPGPEKHHPLERAVSKNSEGRKFPTLKPAVGDLDARHGSEFAVGADADPHLRLELGVDEVGASDGDLSCLNADVGGDERPTDRPVEPEPLLCRGINGAKLPEGRPHSAPALIERTRDLLCRVSVKRTPLGCASR